MESFGFWFLFILGQLAFLVICVLLYQIKIIRRVVNFLVVAGFICAIGLVIYSVFIFESTHSSNRYRSNAHPNYDKPNNKTIIYDNQPRYKLFEDAGINQEYLNQSNKEINANEGTYNSFHSTFHTSEEYKYNFRTGTSGSYVYNYTIEGYDINGNYFHGETDISSEDNYGTGYIYNEDGEEIEVELEWTGYGELLATDSDGNEYEFEIDQ